MFKTISAALIAASLIAGPVLAQGANVSTSAATPAATVKTDAKAKVNTKAKVAKVKKSKKHMSQAIKHRKHVAHVKHAKRHIAKAHVKQVKRHVAKVHAKHLRHVAKVNASKTTN